MSEKIFCVSCDKSGTKPELELRNGKFYRGDVEVLPEIGNWEQINLLRRLEKERNK